MRVIKGLDGVIADTLSLSTATKAASSPNTRPTRYCCTHERTKSNTPRTHDTSMGTAAVAVWYFCIFMFPALLSVDVCFSRKSWLI